MRQGDEIVAMRRIGDDGAAGDHPHLARCQFGQPVLPDGVAVAEGERFAAAGRQFQPRTARGQHAAESGQRLQGGIDALLEGLPRLLHAARDGQLDFVALVDVALGLVRGAQPALDPAHA